MDFFVGFLALAGFACLLLLPWPLCRSLFPGSTVPLPHLRGGARSPVPPYVFFLNGAMLCCMNLIISSARFSTEDYETMREDLARTQAYYKANALAASQKRSCMSRRI